MKGAERIYVYPEFTHTCTERGKDDVGYVREDLVDELVEALEEFLDWYIDDDDTCDRVSKAKAALAKARGEG